ncbi:unnamed protein product [Brassica oleracea var. botrytis]|uniref:(rape) hypothetical protein n=1 Tax=Brassica napus TaxID=3708 RepID=A0A816JQC1_BRANA|nr:unnamed protein product [Brassica napus]
MDGQNSIIIVGGANMRGWTEKMSDDELEIVRNADGVLLQREIPDSINIQVAKNVNRAVVPVILDVGEMDMPIPIMSYWIQLTLKEIVIRTVYIINENHMCCRHHSTFVEHLSETI